MADTNGTDSIEIPSAQTGLNVFLGEIATEFGIPDYFERDKGDFPARIHGYIGGNSVRAFSYFAQNFLRALTPDQGTQLLKQFGVHIPQNEKDRVNGYLTQMNYHPKTRQELSKPNTVQVANPIDPKLLNQFVPGSSKLGSQMAQ